jgi:hypothetical protein
MTKTIFSAVIAILLIASTAQAATSPLGGGTNTTPGFQPQVAHVPDGGSTVVLFGLSLIGLSQLARSSNGRKRLKADC